MTTTPIEADALIRHIGQLVTLAQQPLPHASGLLQVISNAAVAVQHERITWIGSNDEAELLFRHALTEPTQEITLIDAGGVVVTPGLVDSPPTHTCFLRVIAQRSFTCDARVSVMLNSSGRDEGY